MACQVKTAASGGRCHTQTDDSSASESKNPKIWQIGNYDSKFLRLNGDYLAFLIRLWLGYLDLRAHGYLFTVRQLDKGRLWVTEFSKNFKG